MDPNTNKDIKKKQPLKYSVQTKKNIIGKIDFHEQMHINSKNKSLTTARKRVMILFTGGTIGMFRNSQGKFSPANNRFREFLDKFPYFCDEDETYFNSCDDYNITPPSIGDQVIMYKFVELENLIDSTDMNIERLNLILSVLESNYNKYDAFIVLHGTDTMSYTASALSFMIENLKKTVVLTGAQIPIGQTRNDALNNLLCSLIIAGHYSIPEVLVVFDNKILRGNRSTKFTTSSLEAFKSPNYYPLGILGLTISIQWQKIFPCNQDKQTKFVPLKQEIQLIKLTPYGFKTIPSNRYVVIESFGIGNVPTKGDFFKWIKSNSQLPESERKIIINISQVYQSVITNQYEAGHTAFKLGLIPGSDMTCEAAIGKLSYLVSKGYTKYSDLAEMMGRNLRGELTEQQDRYTKHRENYIVNCLTTLDQHGSYRSAREKDILMQAIYPIMLLQKPSKGVIYRLGQYCFDVNVVFPDNSNLLHKLMKVLTKMPSQVRNDAEFEMLIDVLLKENVDTRLIDDQGNSAAFYALEGELNQFLEKILAKSGIIRTTTKRIFKAIKENTQSQNKLLYSLAMKGDKFEYVNSEGRNCVMWAIICGNQRAFDVMKSLTNLLDEENLDTRDIYGHNTQHYARFFNFKLKDEESQESYQQ